MRSRGEFVEACGGSSTQQAIGELNLMVQLPAHLLEDARVAQIIYDSDTGIVIARQGQLELGYGDFGGSQDYWMNLRHDDHRIFEVESIEPIAR